MLGSRVGQPHIARVWVVLPGAVCRGIEGYPCGSGAPFSFTPPGSELCPNTNSCEVAVCGVSGAPVHPDVIPRPTTSHQEHRVRGQLGGLARGGRASVISTTFTVSVESDPSAPLPTTLSSQRPNVVPPASSMYRHIRRRPSLVELACQLSLGTRTNPDTRKSLKTVGLVCPIGHHPFVSCLRL